MRGRDREWAGGIVEIRHLRLVSAIGESGSVTSAARLLSLTQPALSHQLRVLESRLSAPLFIRTSRQMVPTQAGSHLIRLAHRVLPDVDGFERTIDAGGLSEVLGNVRIAMTPFTSYHWVPGVLSAFHDRWPGVNLRLVDLRASAAASLRDGGVDLGIVCRNEGERHLRYEALFDDDLVVVVAPTHPWSARAFVAHEDLDAQTFVGDDRYFGTLIRDHLEPRGARPAQVIAAPFTDTVVALVASGAGVGLLSRWSVAPAIARREVVGLRLGETGTPLEWHAASRADDPTPAYQFDLVKLIRAQACASTHIPYIGRLTVER